MGKRKIVKKGPHLLASATPPGNPVGSVVRVSADDLATLRELRKPVDELKLQLAGVRLDYLANERKLVELVQQANGKYQELVVTIAKKMGLSVGPESAEAWRFEMDKETFTRVG